MVTGQIRKWQKGPCIEAQFRNRIQLELKLEQRMFVAVLVITIFVHQMRSWMPALPLGSDHWFLEPALWWTPSSNRTRLQTRKTCLIPTDSGQDSKHHELERRRGQLNSPAELHCARKLNEYVTIQEPNQFTRVTRLPAKPFVFIGNIWNFKAMRYQDFLKFSGMIGIIFTSDIITQGIAPMPKAKHPLNIWWRCKISCSICKKS